MNPGWDLGAAAAAALSAHGCVLLRGGVDAACVGALALAADPIYARLERAHSADGILPPGTRHLPTAASLGLDLLGGWSRLLEALSPEALAAIRATLGARVSCDVELAWLRRQYPPGARPRGQAPHAWHQDGAYGADFSAVERAAGGLLPVVTAWIPFGPAGKDAPGLELVCGSPAELLPPHALRDVEVDRRFPRAERFRPRMDRGDVLLMLGQCVHRTFVTPQMHAVRTCADLRFVPAEPPLSRLAGHRMVSLPEGAMLPP